MVVGTCTALFGPLFCICSTETFWLCLLLFHNHSQVGLCWFPRSAYIVMKWTCHVILGLSIWLSLKDETASSSVSSGGLAIRRSMGTATLVPAGASYTNFSSLRHFNELLTLQKPVRFILRILRNLRFNIAESSNYEEHEAIMKRLGSKRWNLKEKSDSL